MPVLPLRHLSMSGATISMFVVMVVVTELMFVAWSMVEGKAADGGDHPIQIELQVLKIAVRFARRLVHVKSAIDFDLKAVAVAGGVGISAHQFHAFVRIVNS